GRETYARVGTGFLPAAHGPLVYRAGVRFLLLGGILEAPFRPAVVPGWELTVYEVGLERRGRCGWRARRAQESGAKHQRQAAKNHRPSPTHARLSGPNRR